MVVLHPSTQPVEQASTQPAEQFHPRGAVDVCPWCGQDIPEERSEEILSRIAKKEREQSAAMENRLREEMRKEFEGELANQLEALEKDKTDALQAQQSKESQEREKLKTKVAELTRQLERKRADELGDGAEIDLFEKLKEAFPNDHISRVGKGESGADIRHEIIDNGKRCGTILYDSKNRTRWLNDYVSKLRKDQLDDRADHAILSTTVFPAGKRNLYIQDGVIIIDPTRAAIVAEILRNHIVEIHRLRLSGEQREERRDHLYEFITSKRCDELFDRMDSLTAQLLECDAKEKQAHSTTWKKRSGLITSLQQAKADIASEIECIIGTAASEDELDAQKDKSL